ncbi:hypothetical protein [Pectobacterium brasiliense]|nr:hypothetical protein [Pectobacterium brasiliense]
MLLCLDEATSQLDDAAALQLLEHIRITLPQTIVLAVSHQPAVQASFKHQVRLTPFEAEKKAHTESHTDEPSVAPPAADNQQVAYGKM